MILSWLRCALPGRGTLSPSRPPACGPTLLCVLALLPAAAALSQTAPVSWDREEALAAASALLERGEPAQAEELLLALVGAAPADIEATLSLAQLYEATERREEAVELCGGILARLDPHHEPALRLLRRLYYRGAFPRRLRLEYLKYGPVDFVVDSCRLSAEHHAGGPDSRLFAYTTSLIFPAEMTQGKAAPWIRLPAGSGVGGNLMYNRVAYGLIADPETELLRTDWQMGFPSATVLLSARDYSPLGGRLLHALLRGHIYIREYLGIDQDPWNADLLRAFLTEEGPTGAEQYEDKVFFYDVGQDRAALEWLREAFHELGHLLLPKLGPYEVGERWAEGDLGERLLLGWLAEEAGAVAGDPWPSGAARDVLDKLWSTGHVALSEYLSLNCRTPISAWLALPPGDLSPADGVDRALGFCLWIQAAHGRRLLGDVLRSVSGTDPQGFLAAYKTAVARAVAEGPLTLHAGGLTLIRSSLAAPPVEGPVRLDRITLGPDSHATWRIYLPQGRWAMTPHTRHDEPLSATLSIDEGQPLSADDEGRFCLGEVAEGWHEMVLKRDGGQTVELLHLSLEGRNG